MHSVLAVAALTVHYVFECSTVLAVLWTQKGQKKQPEK